MRVHANHWRRIGLYATLGAGLLALLVAMAVRNDAADAAGPPTVIDFEKEPGPDGKLGTGDDLPLSESPTTFISAQYAPLGVTFSLVGGGAPRIATEGGPVTAFEGPVTNDAPARSGRNSLTPGFASVSSCPCLPSIQADFAFDVESVSVFNMDVEGAGSEEAVRLIAFDGSGVEIDRDVLLAPGFPAGDGSIHALTVAAPAIRRVVVDYSSLRDNGVAIDDFTFERSPPPPGTWTVRTPSCTTRIWAATVGHPNGNIYVTGGSGFQTETNVYDPVTDTWFVAAPLPIGVYGPAGAVGGDGRIYVAGGTSTGGLGLGEADLLQIYDPATDSWTAGPPMLNVAWTPGGAGAPDGRIYVFGGQGAGTVVQIFDPVANSWSFGAPMPSTRIELAAATGNDGLIYVFGGQLLPDSTGVQTLDTLDIYDPVTDSWTSGAPMSRPRNNLAGALGSDGRIYAIGGGVTYSLGGLTDTVESYDPVTNSWRPEPSLSSARGGHGAALAGDGHVYTVAGAGGGAITEGLNAPPPIGTSNCDPLRPPTAPTVDIEIVSLSLVSVSPIPLGVGAPSDWDLNVELRNNSGADPTDADLSVTVPGLPPDCSAVLPATSTHTLTPHGASTNVPVTVTITCSQPSDHEFTFNADAQPNNPPPTDSDPSNNSGPVTITRAFIAEADLALTSLGLDLSSAPPPTSILADRGLTVSQNHIFPSSPTVTNQGPFTPVDVLLSRGVLLRSGIEGSVHLGADEDGATVEVWLSAVVLNPLGFGPPLGPNRPPDLVLTNQPAGTVVTQLGPGALRVVTEVPSLAAGESRTTSGDFGLHCLAPGFQSVGFFAAIEAVDPHVDDPNIFDNLRQLHPGFDCVEPKVDIEIVALSLVSVSPMEVGVPADWDLNVEVRNNSGADPAVADLTVTAGLPPDCSAVLPATSTHTLTPHGASTNVRLRQ